jgi:hypothetical protein
MQTTRIRQWVMIIGLCVLAQTAWATEVPFQVGEKLIFELRWESIPAGQAVLEVLAPSTIQGQPVHHFVLHAKTNRFLDTFYPVRDRIDAFADIPMTRSILYQQVQREGSYKRDITVVFDWEKNQAIYRDSRNKMEKVDLLPGAFDPLSVFYFARMLDLGPNRKIQRPVTDGKKITFGTARILRRETIELALGTFDTYLLEPDIRQVGGVFKQSKGAKIELWVTADERKIPLRIRSKVVIGNFIGELVGVEGIDLEDHQPCRVSDMH